MRKIIKCLVFFVLGWVACSLFAMVSCVFYGEKSDEINDTVHLWPFKIKIGYDQRVPVRECLFLNYPLAGTRIASPNLPWMDSCGGFPGSDPMDERVPVSFYGVCVRTPEGRAVRVLSLNGNSLEKPVLMKFRQDDPKWTPEEGEEYTGIIDVFIPAGKEAEPDSWRQGGEPPRLMKEGGSSHRAEMDDVVLAYYHRQEMEATERYVDILEQMTEDKDSPLLNMALAAGGRYRFKWLSLTANVEKSVYAGFFKRNREILVRQSREAEKALMGAMGKWERRVGRRLFGKERNIQIRMWGIPFPFFVNAISGDCSSTSGS